MHGRIIGLISMVVHGRGCIMKVWMARIIFGIEMGLGAMKTRLCRLGIPLGIVVVVLVVVYGCWWWVVWNQAPRRRLAIVRIVVPLVGHEI